MHCDHFTVISGRCHGSDGYSPATQNGARLRPKASSFQTCYGQGGNGTASFRQWYVPMRLSTTDLYKPTTSLHYLYLFGQISVPLHF
jgi:hypothetical protein